MAVPLSVVEEKAASLLPFCPHSARSVVILPGPSGSPGEGGGGESLLYCGCRQVVGKATHHHHLAFVSITPQVDGARLQGNVHGWIYHNTPVSASLGKERASGERGGVGGILKATDPERDS